MANPESVGEREAEPAPVFPGSKRPVHLEPAPKIAGLREAAGCCCAQLSAGHFKLRKYSNHGFGSKRSCSDGQTPNKVVCQVHGLLDKTPTGDDVLL